MQTSEKRAKNRLQRRLDEPLVASAVSRPVLTLSLLFLLWTALLFGLDTEKRLLFAAFGLVLFGVFWVLTRGRDVGDLHLFSLLLTLSFLLLLVSEAGFGLWQSHLAKQKDRLLSEDAVSTVSVRVRRVQEGRALVYVTQADSVPIGEFAVCDAAEFLEGETYSGKAELFSLNARVGQESVRFFGRDVSLGLEWRETAGTGGEVTLLSAFGEHLSDLLAPAKSASFLRAILLSDKSGIPASFSRTLSSIGASHFLALSGMHLGILMYSLYRLCSLVFLGRRGALTVGLLLGGLFLFLCGVPLSLLRAYVMFALAFFAEILRLRQNSVQSLFLAAALIVFFDRGALSDVGFLLSVSATLGILLFVPLWEKSFSASRLARTLSANGVCSRLLLRILRALLRLGVTSASALTFTLPVAALSFGEVSLLSPIWGILLIPLFTLLLNLAFFFLLSSLLSLPLVTGVLASLCDVLCRAFASVAESCAEVSPMTQWSAEASVFATVLSVLFLAVCLRYRVPARVCALLLPLFLAAATLMTLFLPCFSPAPPFVRLWEESETAYLAADDGTRRICVVSPAPKKDVKSGEDAPLCEVTDLILLPTERAAADVVRALIGRVATERLWIPRVTDEDEKLLDFALSDFEGSVCFYDAGDRLVFDGICLECATDETGVSASLSLSSRRVLFCRAKEERLVSLSGFDAAILFGGATADRADVPVFSPDDDFAQTSDAVVLLPPQGRVQLTPGS
ncbi:MAG: ComEC/Rec2 family competence protein [Clostridia bacterium]|nr:ComEC/Rec2 family competence protein [Clostridia bacterium]